MVPIKYLEVEILLVQFIIYSIYGRIFEFAPLTVYGIKIGIIERTDTGYLIGSSEISKNEKLDGQLYVIQKICNCIWKKIWFIKYNSTVTRTWNCIGIYA